MDKALTNLETDKNIHDLLTQFGTPFAKALAVFTKELLKSEINSISQRDIVTEKPLWNSWDELPVKLRSSFEDEIKKNNNNRQNARDKAVEFNEDGVLIASANRLKRILNEKGIKQKQLAAHLGVSPSAISKVINNPDRSKVNTLKKIAKAIDVELSSFL